ncbi:MAG: hypothetical protein N2376_08215, partial [Clostridia bacterium]|nr:hypothetical protein [Clostridia bacterium]
MMKNWKKIAILGGVLVVFLVAFIVLSGTQKKQTPQSASATPWGQVTPTPSASVDEVKLVDIPKDQITKITLKREGQDIVLTQAERDVEKLVDNGDGTSKKTTEKAKVWETTGFSVDSTAVDDMAASADTATTKRLIDESPKDVTIYGLDKALATTFASGDGKPVSYT